MGPNGFGCINMNDEISMEEIKKVAIDIFKATRLYCISIYLGGSYCQDFIKHKEDVDFICFADEPVNMGFLRAVLKQYLKNHKLDPRYDFIQVRTKQIEEHSYGSYINKEMIKLVGEDIEFTFDIIGKDREEYLHILLDTMDRLNTDKILNKKRWYQVLRGYYALKNNSYDLTEEQIETINKVHDEKDCPQELKDEVYTWVVEELGC